jgi:uncharacterized delta-60 repeat protein
VLSFSLIRRLVDSRRSFASRIGVQSRHARHLRFEHLEKRRMLAAGDLDLSFGGGDGIGTIDFAPGYYEEAADLAIQSDGRMLVIGNKYPQDQPLDFNIARFLVDGSPDPAFGQGGIVATNFSVPATGNPSADLAAGLAVQPDQKIVLVGRMNPNGTLESSDPSLDIALLRYNPDGTLDNTFGVNGKVRTDTGLNDSGTSVAVQPDGKIVVVGERGFGSPERDAVVARYNADGSLDPTFSTDGLAIIDNGIGNGISAAAVTIQPDGRILAGGSVVEGGDLDFAIIRLNTDGSLDSTFGVDGIVRTKFGTGLTEYVIFKGLALQSDGKIVAAGVSDSIDGQSNFAVARYNADGSLDSTFDSDGKLIVPAGSAPNRVQGIDLDSSGRIVLTGWINGPGFNADLVLMRLMPNGALDSAFGSNGIVYKDFGGTDGGADVVVQPDGNIIVAAHGGPGVGQTHVLRYLGGPLLVTNTNDSGPGSLRQAFLDVMALPYGPREIDFNIGSGGQQTIRPLTPLPFLDGPLVTIDGTTQPGFNGTPIIEIDGSRAVDPVNPANPVHGINAHMNGMIRGLVINSFSGRGMELGQSGSVVIEGNYVGVDVSGTVAKGNGDLGISVHDAGNVRIGGTTPLQRNVISGNRGSGIGVNNFVSAIIEGNYIGTDVSGTAAIPNFFGVTVFNCNQCQIGGTTSGAKNVIAGNSPSVGVWIAGGGSNTVEGNYIGVDATGQRALENATGGFPQIFILDSPDNVIGGTDTTARNVITGFVGVTIRGPSAYGNHVAGNYLGVAADGNTNVPLDIAVLLDGGTNNNVIGGLTEGSGNLIQDEHTYGGPNRPAVLLLETAGAGNAILQNSFISPSGMGIDLLLAPTTGGGGDGVTPNDHVDADVGANNGQNYPEIGGVSIVGSSAVFSGMLDSTPNKRFRIEYYSNPATTLPTARRGHTFLDFREVTTDANGLASIDATISLVDPGHRLFVATATLLAADGSPLETSEFSFNVAAVSANAPPTITTSHSTVTINEGATATNTGTYSDANAGDNVTITASQGTVTKTGTNSGTWSWSYFGPDDEATHTVTITADDGHGGIATTTFQLTVNNVAPTATNNSYATSQAIAVSGNVITDNTGSGADSDPAGANDPLTVSSHTNPANGTLVISASGVFTYTPNSTFAGTDSFTYTISDGDDGFATATVTIVVTAAAPGSIVTIPDCCLGRTALLIVGTAGNDTIQVEPGSSSSTLTVTINGVSSTVARPSDRIIVMAGAGDDDVQLAGAIANPAWLYGEAGNDHLNNGSGGGLLLGGDGNDELLGGDGRDVMIGGQGADRLIGNANDDILIAGLTTKDERTSVDHEKFWCEVLAEWSSTNAFAVRVQNLRDGTGGNAHNDGSLLRPEVVDDFFADQIDLLNGSSGDDWLIFLAGEDKVVGQTEETN